MDKLITAIQTTDVNSEKDLKNLRSTLQKAEEVLFKHLPHLDEALSILDPKIHTLGWMYILAVKSIAGAVDPARYVAQVRALIPVANTTQVRLAPSKFARVCQKFAEIHQEQKTPLAAIKLLKIAITKLRPNSESLTPLHADFLQTCLLAKDYRAALPVLSDEVLALANPESYNLKARDVLRFFYYGGMIYTGVKNFGKALEFFKMGFTVPAIVLSAVMAECYKKYVLVSLLHQGAVKPAPKYTSSIVQRNLKGLCPQYQDFANAYASNNTDELHKVATQHAEVFTKDNNFGLVKQCIQDLYRRNIKRHTQTFLTLSLSQIAESVKLASPKDAEKAILRMIEEGQIFASINQKDGMVSFNENPESYGDNRMLNQLDAQIKRTIELAHKLRTVDRDIASSPLYIQKTTGGDRGRGWNDFDMGDIDMGGPGSMMRGSMMGMGMGSRKGDRKGKGKKGLKIAN
jgi:COP9 signalosome complex subunit 3